MITIEDLQKGDSRKYKYVRYGHSGSKLHPFFGQVEKRVSPGDTAHTRVTLFRGTRRATPEEAAQDAADYLNGLTPEPAQVAFHTSTAREAEVIARLEATGKVGTRSEKLDTKPSEPRGKVAGFVYFIRNVRGAVKIGAAVNPLSRLRTFQTANDDNLELIGFIETDDMYGTEQKLHRQFRHARLRGEWFREDDIVVPA